MQDAGFADVRLNDRNAFHCVEVSKEVDLVKEKLSELEQRIGAEQAQYRLASSLLRQQVIDEGFLRPTHFVGLKP